MPIDYEPQYPIKPKQLTSGSETIFKLLAQELTAQVDAFCGNCDQRQEDGNCAQLTRPAQEKTVTFGFCILASQAGRPGHMLRSTLNGKVTFTPSRLFITGGTQGDQETPPEGIKLIQKDLRNLPTERSIFPELNLNLPILPRLSDNLNDERITNPDRYEIIKLNDEGDKKIF